MGSTFTDRCLEDLPVFYDLFGQAATFAGQEVTVILETLPMELDLHRTSQPARLRVRESELPSPAVNDAVVIGSVSYVVVGVPAAAAEGEWILDLQADERPVV